MLVGKLVFFNIFINFVVIIGVVLVGFSNIVLLEIKVVVVIFVIIVNGKF